MFAKDWLIAALLFVIGAILATMLAFWLATNGMESGGAVAIMRAWFPSVGYLGWWPWPLGGGAVFALSYITWRLVRSR